MECYHFQYHAFLKSKQPVESLVFTEVNFGGNGKLGFQNKGKRKDQTMYSRSDNIAAFLQIIFLLFNVHGFNILSSVIHTSIILRVLAGYSVQQKIIFSFRFSLKQSSVMSLFVKIYHLFTKIRSGKFTKTNKPTKPTVYIFLSMCSK